ncbi:MULTISPECIES: hypothetical protein [unclassified Mesorhizobium]|nr:MULTISPECIES: hypothetical protein [unclassified Mesorhizobium]
MAFVLKTRGGTLDDKDSAQLAALTVALQQASPQLLRHLHGGLVTKRTG